MSSPRNTSVWVLSQLNEQALMSFLSNQVTALHVKQYVSPKLCRLLSQYFIEHEHRTKYQRKIELNHQSTILDYGVERIGGAYNTTYGKSKRSPEWKAYYHQALQGMQQLRQICSPYLSPIDRLRVELDEQWPQGCNLANFEGRKMFAGLGRVCDAENSHVLAEYPHTDSLPQIYAMLAQQFSANVYLQLPNSGGELEIRDLPPIDPEESTINLSFKILWGRAGEPILIKPAVGDLVLFNSRKPHLVRSFKRGTRVTLQCFLGVYPDQRLVLWS